MRLPDGGEILRHNSADASKIGVGLGRVWDRIVGFLSRRGWIPHSWYKKLCFIEAMSLAGATLKANVKGETVFSNIVLEVGTDAASEIGLRMLEMPDTPTEDTSITQAIPVSPRPPLGDRLADGLNEITRRLNGADQKQGEES